MAKNQFTIIERFMRHVSIQHDGCWIWTASIDRGGYGQFAIRVGGVKNNRAHRVSYLLHRGPVPDGLQLDHLCRVRRCVNPVHLEAVTMIENVRRGIGGVNGGKALGLKKRSRTHCKNGHEFAAGNEMWQNAQGKRWRYCRTCKKLSRTRAAEKV